MHDYVSRETLIQLDVISQGAYTYQAEQRGNTVVLQQMELTDYANMPLRHPEYCRDPLLLLHQY